MHQALESYFPDLYRSRQKVQLPSTVLEQHDTAKPLCTFQVDDPVYVKDFSASNNPWIPGKVTKVKSPRRHVDVICQLSTTVSLQPQETATPVSVDDIYLPAVSCPPTPPVPDPTPRIQSPPAVLRRSAPHCPLPDYYSRTRELSLSQRRECGN